MSDQLRRLPRQGRAVVKELKAKGVESARLQGRPGFIDRSRTVGEKRSPKHSAGSTSSSIMPALPLVRGRYANADTAALARQDAINVHGVRRSILRPRN